MKKILVYGMSDHLADAYQIVAERYGIAMYVIGDRILTETVRDAFRVDQDMDGTHEKLDGVFMLFHEIEIPEIVQLLMAFKAEGLAYEGVKVMETQANAGFMLLAVLGQAKLQADIVAKAVQLKELMEEAKNRDLSSLTREEKSDYREVLEEAAGLTGGMRIDIEAMDTCYEKLKNYIAKTRKMYN